MDGIVSYKSYQQVAEIVDHGRIDNAQLRLKSCFGEPGKIAMHHAAEIQRLIESG